MKIDKQLKPALISHWAKKAFSTFYPKVTYTPTPDAPEKFSDLKQFSGALSGDLILPIYDGACDRTIYDKPADNVTFRAWHDSIHLEKNLTFKKADEYQVGIIHCDQLRIIRAPQQVIDAVFYDVCGQIEYYERFGRFVDDQKAFVQDCLIHGLDFTLSKHYDCARNIY